MDRNTNRLDWQQLYSPDTERAHQTWRSKIPGGWLVSADFDLPGEYAGQGCSITFVPDPEHKWDGGSVE